MKNLSRFQIGMIVAFVVVAVLGVAAWWYTGTLQAEASERLVAANRTKTTLAASRYTPGAASVKILTENIEQMKATLAPIESEILLPDDHLLLTAEPMNPTAWKTEKLTKAIDRMQALAAKANLALPAVTDGRYFFGYSRYATTATPPAAATVMLSKQLLGIEMAFKALSEAGGVRQLTAIRRTFDEDGAVSRSVGGASDNSGADEQLPLAMVKPDGGLYEVYPLEFVFVGDPDGLRGFLNQLAKSPLIYAVRSVATTTSEPSSPRLSTLKEQFSGNESGNKLLPFGQETIMAKVRFDLIDWRGEVPAPDDADQGKQARK